MKDTKVIGLTGGIGTGKSTAAKYLKEKGFEHIDADEIGRNITKDGSRLLPVLDSVFGPDGCMGEKGVEIIDEKGSLKRKTLASLVFSDVQKKEKLDEIMFSEIISVIDDEIRGFKDDETCKAPGILIDAPLLFEAGLDSRCDIVLVLTADENVRIQRVCSRDNATEDEVRARIRNQLDDRDKIKMSDVVIDNSEDEEALYEKLGWFIEEWIE